VFEIVCGAKCTCTIVCSPNLLFFSLHYTFDWPSPILKLLVCHITFVVNLWTLWGFTFFVATMARKDNFSWCYVGCFYVYYEGCGISCFMWKNPHSSTSFFLVYMSMGQHYGFGGYCLDVGWCCHLWTHSNIFNTTCKSILWGCCYNCDSG
jgi:hypothetical protein